MIIKTLQFLLIILLFFSCKESEEDKVKSFCIQFMDARIALEDGDSLGLKLITDEKLFELIMLNHEYEKSLSAPINKPNLNIYPKTVTIIEDKASCLMSGLEDYEINLSKNGNSWKVDGENGRYPNSFRLNSIKTKIAEHKKYVKEKPLIALVVNTSNALVNNAQVYFKTQELGLLKDICDEASIDFIERLYLYAEERSGLEALFEEMNKPKGIAFNPVLNGNEVVCEHYDDNASILLKKEGNKYIVIGFNGIASGNISKEIMKKDYLVLLRSLGLIRLN